MLENSDGLPSRGNHWIFLSAFCVVMRIKTKVPAVEQVPSEKEHRLPTSLTSEFLYFGSRSKDLNILSRKCKLFPVHVSLLRVAQSRSPSPYFYQFHLCVKFGTNLVKLTAGRKKKKKTWSNKNYKTIVKQSTQFSLLDDCTVYASELMLRSLHGNCLTGMAATLALAQRAASGWSMQAHTVPATVALEDLQGHQPLAW